MTTYKMQVEYHGDWGGYRFHGFIISAKSPEKAFEKLEKYIADEIDVGVVHEAKIVKNFLKRCIPKTITIK